ncbi:MAG: GTP-binding protein [Candidatus Methanospirareceae archaeon]
MNVHVVLVGHIDHGKSTLIGRLLYDSESIQDERVAEIQKLAEEYKRRFEFAYFLDSFEDELKEERTIDTVSLMFKSTKNFYTITDVPGHKEFIKNMLTGASHADVAVLVVAADEGVREQTRRHLFLLKMLGITQVFVVVNKMDKLQYNEDQFAVVRNAVSELLTAFDFKNDVFIPISAMEGDNIYQKSAAMGWYNGPTLIETLDGVQIRRAERPFRFVVQDTYTVDSEKLLVGRVESGSVRQGDEVFFAPAGIRSTVKRIRILGKELDTAYTGDSIGLLLENDGTVARGNVAGLMTSPPVPTEKFVGEAVLLDRNLRQGETLELRCGTAKVRCRIEEIREKIDSQTGEVIASNPEEIQEHDAATILFQTEPVVVERFVTFPELGRFVLVKEGRNIGAGVVLST